MPDGKRNGYKLWHDKRKDEIQKSADNEINHIPTDKGLKSDTGNANFLYRDVEEYDEETTAEAMRRACCFNFNNFIHSAQRMTKAMESTNSDVDESGLRRSRCNSGDSDLVVLSVVLNKKQKENDEVALAIERLRQNGVNCVIFKMNDIRNGNTRPDAPSCECFRITSISGTPRINNILSSCSCNPRSTNVLKSDEIQQISPSLIPAAPNEKIEVPHNLVVNLSPTPSPSPPPQQPASPLPDTNLFFEMSNADVIEPKLMGPVKKKPRRKRKYPYSIRKPTRSKKPKLINKLCAENATGIPPKAEVGANELDDVKITQVLAEISPPTVETVSAIEELVPKVVEEPSTVVANLEKSSEDSEIRLIEVKSKTNKNGFQSTKKKGRKSKGERFEEAFQIAVQSFVETTKEKDLKTSDPVCIPGVRRSMYTRSRSSVNALQGSHEYVSKFSKSKLIEVHPNKRKTRKPRQLKATNVKAICIRNIFVGPTLGEPRNTDDIDKVDQAVGKQVLSTEENRINTPLELKNPESEFVVDQKQSRRNKSKPCRQNVVPIVSAQNTKVQSFHASLEKFQSSEDLFDTKNGDPNLKTSPEQSQKTKTANDNTIIGRVRRETRSKERLESIVENGIVVVGNAVLDMQNVRRDVRTSEKDKLLNIHISIDNVPVEPHQSDCERTRRAFSPDITKRAKRKKGLVKETNEVAAKAVITEPKVSVDENITSITSEESNVRLMSNNNSTEHSAETLIPEISEDALMQAVQETLDSLISSVVFCTEMELTIPESRKGEWDDMPDIRKNDNVFRASTKGNSEEPPVLTLEVPHADPTISGLDDSLPDTPDSMQLRRSSFYSLVTGNVRVNLENYLDGRVPTTTPKRKRRIKNGFLLHHGDNCPEHPESPYKLHLATQVLLKLNRRRSKCKPKEERTKTVLSYLKLTSKRPVRTWKGQAKTSEELESDSQEQSVFSGEWSLTKKYICGVCGQPENCFWDMVTHKGEEHPGVVVTHVELPPTQETPTSLIRKARDLPSDSSAKSPSCSKCSAAFSTLSDLHNHIFDCAGNASWLAEKTPTKRKGRRRGFKRRFSNTPKKHRRVETPKRRTSDLHKCVYCTREFKTEGWLKNHMMSHSLPVSIPLDKLPLASLPVRACLKKSTNCTHHLRNSAHQFNG